MSDDRIMAATRWRSNAELIADVARLGYLHEDWVTIDTTYGKGTFWKRWRPRVLMTHDIKLDGVDFRKLPYGNGAARAVVFDGPYKLNGKPTEEVDERYGVDIPATIAERHELLLDGLTECARVCAYKGFVLAKCMDQVASGRKWWQARMLANHAEEELGMRHVDSFHLLNTPRKQRHPQKHAAQNFSTLLILKKEH